MSRDTTWTKPEDPASGGWESSFESWFAKYFEGHATPSARGGFEDDSFSPGLTACKSCGAAVMTMDYLGSSSQVNLNRHRAWHDENDRD